MYRHFDKLQDILLLFSMGKGCFVFWMYPEQYPPQKDYQWITDRSVYTTACYSKQLCMWPCSHHQNNYHTQVFSIR